MSWFDLFWNKLWWIVNALLFSDYQQGILGKSCVHSKLFTAIFSAINSFFVKKKLLITISLYYVTLRASTFEAVTKWKADLDSKVTLADGSPVPCVLLANKVSHMI
jgi:hypothetical protein